MVDQDDQVQANAELRDQMSLQPRTRRAKACIRANLEGEDPCNHGPEE